MLSELLQCGCDSNALPREDKVREPVQYFAKPSRLSTDGDCPTRAFQLALSQAQGIFVQETEKLQAKLDQTQTLLRRLVNDLELGKDEGQSKGVSQADVERARALLAMDSHSDEVAREPTATIAPVAFSFPFEQREASDRPAHFQEDAQQMAPINPSDIDPANVHIVAMHSHCNEDAEGGSLEDVHAEDTPEHLPRPRRQSQVQVVERALAAITADRFAFFVDSSRQRSLAVIIQSTLFNSVTALVIVLNAVQLGVDADIMASGQDSPVWLQAWSVLCAIYFAVECALRLYAFGLKFFTEAGSAWNIFDLLLVFLSFADFITLALPGGSDGNRNLMNGLKALKMLRIVRVFRVFRFIKELSSLMVMIGDSVSSLLWALVMLLIIIYVFAVCLLNFSSEWIKERGSEYPAIAERMQIHFGSTLRAAYTLILVMLDGIDWGRVLDDVMLVGWAPFALLLFYVLFTYLAVLNVVTGVFVDRALQAEKSQREYQVEVVMKARERFKRQILGILETIDSNMDGQITMEELDAMLQDDRLAALWESLGFLSFGKDMQAERLFRLLDDNDSGVVSLEEFLDKCGHLKGQASAMDLMHVQTDVRHLHTDVRHLMTEMAHVQDHLRACKP